MDRGGCDRVIVITMKKRRAREEEAMVDEALQKASRLIGLLQRDNDEYQRKQKMLESQLVEANSLNQHFSYQNQQLEARVG